MAFKTVAASTEDQEAYFAAQTKPFANIKALEFRKELKELGINTQLLALTEITNEKLENFRAIDAFVQVACPRLGTDNFFSKPVLSVPQAVAFIKLLKKEPIEEFFKLQHWL